MKGVFTRQPAPRPSRGWRFVLLGLAVVASTVAALELPELQRYLKMRSM